MQVGVADGSRLGILAGVADGSGVGFFVRVAVGAANLSYTKIKLKTMKVCHYNDQLGF
jgi:hypothetical protein